MSDPIIHYHERTKHHLHRYARSLGYMDWQNQPNPFRFWKGTEVVRLPLLDQDPDADHANLYEQSDRTPQPLTRKTLAGFLELSLGLSAWKAAAGTRWSLRINPSSGNLHPTEAHLLLTDVENIENGVYHYSPFLHALEKRAAIPTSASEPIKAFFQNQGFLVILTSIFWREAWKYGERAYRYCNHDVGHALAALSFAANLWGWQLTCLNGLSDDQIEILLGFDRTVWPPLEEEHPDIACFVGQSPPEIVTEKLTLPQQALDQVQQLSFVGQPERLSKQPVNWRIINETAHQARKPVTSGERFVLPEGNSHIPRASRLKAAQIIRQRRSATAFDPDGRIDADRFLALLDRTLPRKGRLPFDCHLIEPSVHLLLFVHSVTGYDRGLYFLCRNPLDLDAIRSEFRPEYLWRQMDADLPLYLLREGDFRADAVRISCHQDIAGDSAFSLGMLARLKKSIDRSTYFYRHLFWETGLIGQVLYLEAEAQGIRGTGIGCFFDDAVHAMAGINSANWQSLYHFTVGHPIEDHRLTTLPPYVHLKDHR